MKRCFASQVCPHPHLAQAAAVIGFTAACGSVPAALQPAAIGTPAGSLDETRGMDVRPADRPVPDAADGDVVAVASVPFVKEVRLHARRTLHGHTIAIEDVHSGDTLIDGDRLQLSITTSHDGYLYLAFCSQGARDPRYPGLTIFPDRDAIPVAAGDLTIAPGNNAEIVLDDRPGHETLYVILSRSELSRSDDRLAYAIAAARRSSHADCGSGFRDAVARPRKTAARSTAPSPGLKPADAGPPDVGIVRLGADRPVVEIERGGYAGLGEDVAGGIDPDPQGIVVLRYDLEHVAAARD